VREAMINFEKFRKKKLALTTQSSNSQTKSSLLLTTPSIFEKEKQRIEIQLLHSLGFKTKKICKKIGLPCTTVRKWKN